MLITLSIKIGNSLTWSSWAWVINNASGRYSDDEDYEDNDDEFEDKGDDGNSCELEDADADDDVDADADDLNPISENPFSILWIIPWPISTSMWNIFWSDSFFKKIEHEVFE